MNKATGLPPLKGQNGVLSTTPVHTMTTLTISLANHTERADGTVDYEFAVCDESNEHIATMMCASNSDTGTASTSLTTTDINQADPLYLQMRCLQMVYVNLGISGHSTFEELFCDTPVISFQQ